MYPYGPWSYTVMISDKKLIDKYSKMDAFMHRPEIWQQMQPHGYPINFSTLNGPEYAPRRKLFQSTIIRMTDSRFFTEFVQKNIKDKILFPAIENAIKTNNGKWDPWDAAFCYTFNTIYGASFGPECVLDAKDADYLEMKRIIEQQMSTILWFFMMTALMPDRMKKIAQEDKGNFQRTQREILNRWIEKRENDKVKSEEPSYIDMMFDSKLDRETAISDVVVAFAAGAHTTASSVVNQLYYLAKYPNIQQQIYDELRQINENKDEIELTEVKDFRKLYENAHVLRAFMEEVWRLPLTATGNPRQLPHDFKMEFEINGKKDYYILPKGAFIDFNGPYLARDKKNGWKKPLEFDVENYLDKNGKFRNPVSGLDVFGYGNRDCPGMALARKENMFALALLIYHYRFCGPNGDGDDKFNVPFFGLNPLPFPLTVIKR